MSLAGTCFYMLLHVATISAYFSIFQQLVGAGWCWYPGITLHLPRASSWSLCPGPEASAWNGLECWKIHETWWNLGTSLVHLGSIINLSLIMMRLNLMIERQGCRSEMISNYSWCLLTWFKVLLGFSCGYAMLMIPASALVLHAPSTGRLMHRTDWCVTTYGPTA